MSRISIPVFLGGCAWLGLTLAGLVFHLPADDSWPQFRGPGGQGLSPASKTPVHFNATEGVQWSVPIEGIGWSSPVVCDGRIWLTTAITQTATPEEREEKLAGDPLQGIKDVAGAIEIKAICLRADTGQQLHSISLAAFSDPDPINPLNSYASPTPVIDGERVYCDFGNYGTWCLNAASGETLWQRRIVVDYSVGPGSSPIICQDKLILVCDGVDQQFVVALDKMTGEETWRTPRPPMAATNKEFKKAYSTPLVIEVNGQDQLVVPTAQWICGYAPETGEELWRIDHGQGFSVAPRPIVVNDLVVFATGYMRPELVAIRPNGRGDVTQTHIAWRLSQGVPAKPSPIAAGDRIFMIADNGILTQVRAQDGSIVWKERLAGDYSASPINAGGKLYFCSHQGVVTVVADSDEYRALAKNEVGTRMMASPAVIGNDLLIRTENALLRIGG